MVAVARRRVRTSSADERRQRREQARRLLAREIPFIYQRRFLQPRFVQEHLRLARTVLQAAADAPPSEPVQDSTLAGAVGSGWKLVPLLTPDQEQSLFIALNALRYQANSLRTQINLERPAARQLAQLEQVLAEVEAIRRHLVEANVRLVISIAGKLADQLNSVEDLCGEGLVILLKAIDGFDVSRGFRFSTYATNSLQRHFFRLRRRALRKRQFCQPVSDDLLGTVPGDVGLNLTPDDPQLLVKRLISAAHSRLNPRERQIVGLRFGLGPHDEHTLREIAGVLGISKERVRQVLAGAVTKLQEVATELRLEWTPRDLAPLRRPGV